MKEKILEILDKAIFVADVDSDTDGNPLLEMYSTKDFEMLADEILVLLDEAINDIYQEQREITDLLISVTPKKE